MKIHHFDHVTKAYIGTSDAHLDPEEHRQAVAKAVAANSEALSITVTLDKWIIPANATAVPVPPVDDETIHSFINGAWRSQKLRDIAQPEPTEEELANRIRNQALSALHSSDANLLRLYERGTPVPIAMADYRDALRVIIESPSKDSVIPQPPDLMKKA